MVKKRSSSEGTIYQLPSGHWRAQICIDKKRLSTTKHSKAEARDWVREMQDQVKMGMTYEASQTTLASFIRGWMASKRLSIRTATYEQYEIMCRVYILPKLGKHKLIDLTPAILQSFIDELSMGGAGARTVQVVRGVLQNALSQAQVLGVIRHNPVSITRSPKLVKKELHVWTEDQVVQFLNSIHGERNEFLYNIALNTGMRQGELLGLKWKDIDWRREVIMVKRQAVELKGGGYDFAEPKSSRSQRSVDLGVGSVENLRKQFELVNMQRQVAGDGWKENDLVFPSTVGTPQLGTNLDRDFKRMVARSGCPRIRFHDMRHTAASLMLSRGIPAVTVAGMLGHTVSILLSTYAHFIPGNQAEAARVMDEITSPRFFADKK